MKKSSSIGKTNHFFPTFLLSFNYFYCLSKNVSGSFHFGLFYFKIVCYQLSIESRIFFSYFLYSNIYFYLKLIFCFSYAILYFSYPNISDFLGLCVDPTINPPFSKKSIEYYGYLYALSPKELNAMLFLKASIPYILPFRCILFST